MRELRYLQAINEAIREEMARDPRVLVLGEDVRVGLMRATAGLVEEFGPERVIDTPTSEAGFTGMALGAAMAGLRPVVEYEITTITYVAMDQLINQVMKVRYMTGGQATVPLTIRCVSSGAGGAMAGQHSDHPYPMLLNAGLKVIMPSNAYDVKGMLKTAIREDDPVIVFEPAKLMGARGEVPEGEYTIPLGKAEIKRRGKDVTIVAVGYLVREALKASENLSRQQGIECEIIDPRSLQPLDRDVILDSVRRTGRLVVADDANRTCGFASEVAALTADVAWDSLRAPIRRVTRGGYVVPFARALEAEVLPDSTAIERTVIGLLSAAASVS